MLLDWEEPSLEREVFSQSIPSREPGFPLVSTKNSDLANISCTCAVKLILIVSQLAWSWNDRKSVNRVIDQSILEIELWKRDCKRISIMSISNMHKRNKILLNGTSVLVPSATRWPTKPGGSGDENGQRFLSTSHYVCACRSSLHLIHFIHLCIPALDEHWCLFRFLLLFFCSF